MTSASVRSSEGASGSSWKRRAGALQQCRSSEQTPGRPAALGCCQPSAVGFCGALGPHFLFTAFNLVNNGVSLLVTHSAKYLRHLKGETVRIGKKSVFKYCKRRSE